MNVWHAIWLVSVAETLLLLFKWYGRRPDLHLTAVAFFFVIVSGRFLASPRADSVVVPLLMILTAWIATAFLAGSIIHHRQSRHGRLREERSAAQELQRA